MLNTAFLKDGKEFSKLKYKDGENLLEMLRWKGWKPEQGDLLKLPGDIEVLREKEIPPGNEVQLELVRKSQGKRLFTEHTSTSARLSVWLSVFLFGVHHDMEILLPFSSDLPLLFWFS